jgi:hypothetical protein
LSIGISSYDKTDGWRVICNDEVRGHIGQQENKKPLSFKGFHFIGLCWIVNWWGGGHEREKTEFLCPVDPAPYPLIIVASRGYEKRGQLYIAAFIALLNVALLTQLALQPEHTERPHGSVALLCSPSPVNLLKGL